MKKKFINGMLVVAMMIAAMGSFVSCKDYDEDAYAELQGQDKTLGEQIEELQKTLKLNYDELKALQQQCAQNCSIALAEHKAAAEVAKQAIEQKITDVETAMKLADDALNGRVDSLAAVTADLGLTIINVQNTVSTLQQTVNNYMQKSDSIFNAHSTAITNNTNSIQDILNVHIPAVVAQAAAAQATANYALELAKADSTRINALDAKLIDEIAKVTKLANDNLDSAKVYTDRRVEVLRTEVLDSLSLVNTKLKDLENAYKAADALLQEQLDKLTVRVNALEPQVAANTKSINNLFDALNKVVSGVLIQGTYNPVFGSFALPVNVQSNVLMAYYGQAGSYGVEFPSIYPRFYVNEAEVLSEKDIEMLGVTSYTVADGATIVGNAGKVYVTVNPTNVNFTGKVLPIVNSLDEESAIKLSPLVYSDHKLQFGYSRSAENGFYEANATLAAEDVEKVAMKFDFNASDIKATVKDVLNPLNGVNVTNAVNTVVDVLSQFNQKLDANALKATWTDTVGTRSVYSNYNLAATAVKPLSYKFLYDANYTSFPGFDRMRNIVGRVKDKISNKLKVILPEFSFDLDIDKIKEIKFDSININTDDINLDLTVTYKDTIETSVTIKIEDYIEIDVDTDVEIPDQTFEVEVPLNDVPVYDDHGVEVGRLNTVVKEEITVPGQVVKAHLKDNIPYNWTGVVPVEVPVDIEIPVDMTEFKKMINEIEGMEDDINGMLAGQQDNINDIINTINSYLDQLGDLTELGDKFAVIDDKIDETADRIKNKIIQYLDKIENKLLAAINSANKVLQPVMLVKTVDGFQRLSETIYSPTRMSSGNVKFVPTSYTAEMIAPAYKKLVGVTNVYSVDRTKNAQAGDSNCKAALDAANSGNVAKVLDGDVLTVNFSAKKGYIYEIVYTAVDYSGMNVAKKFYVTVE